MFSGLISQTTGGKRRKRNLLLVAAAVAAVALVLVISLASRHNKQGCGSMDFGRFFGIFSFRAFLGDCFSWQFGHLSNSDMFTFSRILLGLFLGDF